MFSKSERNDKPVKKYLNLIINLTILNICIFALDTKLCFCLENNYKLSL